MSAVSATPGDIIYVNGSGGNDSWDGQSAIYNNTTGSGPKLSINNAIGTVNVNGTIYIANGTYNEPEMTINQNMTIIGESQGGTIINALGYNRIFNINPEITVTLENLTLANGLVTGDGGAIYNDGTLTITNCIFTNNEASLNNNQYTVDGYGGAIYNGGTMTITHSTFTNNYAPAGGSDICNSGRLTLMNSTFTKTGTNASVFGGAIYNGGRLTISIVFDTFISSINYYDTPVQPSIGTLNITNSTFNGYWAHYGGAIYSYNGILNITSSTFTNNAPLIDGGTIYNKYGSIDMNFNRIIGRTGWDGKTIYNSNGIVNANNNWWGNNNPNFGWLIYGMPDPDSWLMMSATASPTSIQVGDTSTITVTILSYNRIINTFSPVEHCAPLPAIFTATNGDMNPGYTFIIPNLGIDQIISLFTATQEGTATINATVDYETVIFSIQADKTLTNITVLNVTGYYGNNATLTAILKDDLGQPVVGETVYFLVDLNTIGSGTTDSTGTATINYPLNFSVGSHTIQAVFHDDPYKYEPSAGTGTLTVNINPTTVLVAAAHNFAGQNITLTAHVTDYYGHPVNEGSVRFTVNGSYVNTVSVNNGEATLNWQIPSNWNVGTYPNSIFAEYLGTSNYTASNIYGNLTVDKTPTNVTVPPVHNFAGQTATLIANVTDYYNNPVNSGTVIFTVDGTTLNPVPVNNGIATLNWTIPLNWNVNIYTITADFNGTSTNYVNSTNSSVLTVDQTPTTVTVTPVDNFPGQNVILTANITDYYGHPVNEGSVRFTVNGSYVNTVSVNNGEATLNWTIPPNWSSGNYNILIEYLGTCNLTASNSTGNLTVDPTPTNITIGNVTGVNTQTVNLNATLTDTYGNPLAHKTINFKINGTSIGSETTNSNGTATLNYNPNSAGISTVTAEFAGDSEYVSSTSNGTLTIDLSSDLYLIITSNNNNPKVGKRFILTYKLGNNGPDAATNVKITISLPEGFKYTNISGDGKWTYNANNNTITWTLTNVPVGDPYLYISGHVNKAETYVFSSSISSETYNINTEGVTPITINAASEVKAASKTIPLQKTGLPLAGFVLSVLMVFGGLIMPKMKN